MDNATVVVSQGWARRSRHRIAVVVAAVAVALAVVMLSQGQAEAQIDFRQIFCSILLAVRNAFAGSPFFQFVAAAIDGLLVAFGCVASG